MRSTATDVRQPAARFLIRARTMARSGTAGVTGAFLLMCAGAAQAAEEDPPWAGSEVSLKHSVSVLTFDKGAEPDYNPLVLQSLSIDPTWRFTKKFRLTGH